MLKITPHYTGTCYPAIKKNSVEIVPVNSCDTVKTAVKMLPEHYRANFLSFGKLEDKKSYNDDYSEFGLNGCHLDEFVFNMLQKYHPVNHDKGYKPKVLDIAAGDGRNAIELGMKGYDITAWDTADKGLELIKYQCQLAGKPGLVKTEDVDILESVSHRADKGSYDAVIITLLFQHFTPKELENTLKRASEMLKPGGTIMFNALVRQEGYQKVKTIFDPESAGFLNHNQRVILKSVKSAGFELAEPVTDYQEPHNHRPYFINDFTWGNEPESDYNFKVKLRWFVARKT